MDENRATAAGDTGPAIVVEFYDEVVKPILPPQTVPLLIWTAFDGMIIPAMFGVFDPRVVWPDRLGRQQSWRMREAIGAPP